MKTKKIFSIVSLLLLFATYVTSQTISPVLQFNENPVTHNMHICSDGKYFYTVNGGKVPDGQINKFSLKGEFINSVSVELDMRGIIYNKSEKSFYVNSYDKNIYKISDINTGTYELVFSELFDNEQSCIAAYGKDKYFYTLNFGDLSVYSFKSGEKIKTIKGIMCGDEYTTGAVSVAVDKKKLYTFSGEKREVYIYNKKDLKYKETKKISKGDYGFSISTANNYFFIATDGNYETGTWYGYKF